MKRIPVFYFIIFFVIVGLGFGTYYYVTHVYGINKYAKDSVFRISVCSTTNNVPDLAGMGFAIDKHTILTNYHVVKCPRSITAYDSKGNGFPVSLYSYDIKSDIALLRTTKVLFPIKMEKSPQEIGTKVFTIKNWAIRYGKLIAKEQSFSDVNMVLKFMVIEGLPTEKGDSGSPIINSHGKVIGFIVAQDLYNDQTYSFAIPIEEAHKIIAYLMEKKIYPHKLLGISAITLTKHHPNYPGLVVDKVVQRTPAYGKLQTGDIIKEFNRVPILSYQDLGYELFKLRNANNLIHIQVLRNGKLVLVNVSLTKTLEKTS